MISGILKDIWYSTLEKSGNIKINIYGSNMFAEIIWTMESTQIIAILGCWKNR